tara:strand:- start:599 stop:967 length:369 start_codon:yes stop_codon:yes gene_type:complete
VSNLANIVGGVVALTVINRLLDRTDKVAPTPTPTPAPIIPTIGPAGPSVEDYKLIRESFTQGQNQGSGLTFSPITIKTLETFDPNKKVTVGPSGTMEQALIQRDAIKQGNIKKFGSDLYFGI